MRSASFGVVRRHFLPRLQSGSFVFIALEELIFDFVSDELGLQSRMSTVLGGVIAALTFRPISKRVERLIRQD